MWCTARTSSISKTMASVAAALSPADLLCCDASYANAIDACATPLRHAVRRSISILQTHASYQIVASEASSINWHVSCYAETGCVRLSGDYVGRAALSKAHRRRTGWIRQTVRVLTETGAFNVPALLVCRCLLVRLLWQAFDKPVSRSVLRYGKLC